MIIKHREITGSPLAGIDPMIDQIYRARSVACISNIQYELKGLIPYQDMKGIDQACELLYRLFISKDKVVIIGDYDVDGATATSVMVAGLREMGLSEVDFLIPN